MTDAVPPSTARRRPPALRLIAAAAWVLGVGGSATFVTITSLSVQRVTGTGWTDVLTNALVAWLYFAAPLTLIAATAWRGRWLAVLAILALALLDLLLAAVGLSAVELLANPPGPQAPLSIAQQEGPAWSWIGLGLAAWAAAVAQALLALIVLAVDSLRSGGRRRGAE